MGAKGNEMRRAVRKFLQEFGIPEPYHFNITGGGHQRVTFLTGVVWSSYTFPGSHSDRRAIANTRTELRKVVRSRLGTAVPGGPEDRPVLDARGVLPRQPHHMAGREACLRENKTQAWLTTQAREGKWPFVPGFAEDA